MKKPDWKPALILSGTVFVLGSFTYWLQFSHKPKKERSDAQTKKPLNFKAETDQIAAFRIKSSTGVIEGKCESLAKKTCKVGSTAEWTLTYPETLTGDGDAIRDYLNNASGMSATETISLAEETPEKRQSILEEYGLSDAKRTSMNTQFLELTLENGTKVTAWFGENHPIGDKIFVGAAENGKLNTETIFLVSNFYRSNFFDKNLTHFRDKTLFKFERSEVESFNARTPSGKLDGRLNNGVWTLNGMEADQDRVGTVLASISQARAKDFPDAAALKGAKSMVSYELKLKTGAPIHFELFEKKEGSPGKKGQPPLSRVYLKSPDLKRVYEVDSNLLVQTQKKRDDLRRNLLLTQAEKVLLTRFRMQGPAFPSPVEFHFEGSSWVQKDQGTKLDSGKVKDLLERMALDHSPEIASPAPSKKTNGLSLILGDEKNPRKFSFQFYESQGKSWAKNTGSSLNEAYLLTDALKNILPMKVDSWKAK